MPESAVTSMAAEARYQAYLDWMEDAPSALSACIHFYALDAALTLEWPHRLAADRLREKIEQEQQEYDRALGYALRDYLALASWGELLRHPDGAGVRITDPRMQYVYEYVDYGRARTRYELALQVHLPTLLQQLAELHIYRWDEGSSVAGPLWASIARLAAEFPGTDDPRKLHIWIDRVWDLRHNSGPAFDKPVIFGRDISPGGLFAVWLDAKRYAATPDWLLKEMLMGHGPLSDPVPPYAPDWWYGTEREDMAAFRPLWDADFRGWSMYSCIGPYCAWETRRLLERVAGVLGWRIVPWASQDRVAEHLGVSIGNQKRMARSVSRILAYQPMPWGDGPAMDWEPIEEDDW